VNPAFIAAANWTAAVLPRTFKDSAGRRFVTPQARKQSDTGRDWLETLEAFDFKGPKGRQRAWLGGPEDGRLVFLQHGWEADSADLTTMGQALCETGLRVALVDGPAHGASEGRTAGLPWFAEGLGALAEQLAQPFAVVGHSMGFPATVRAITRHGLSPDRLVSLGAPDALPRNVRFQAKAMGMSERAVELMLEAVSERFGAPAEEFDIMRDAPAMTASALILHGRNDQIAPPEGAERIAATWPRAELELFDDLGHRGVLRDERVVARVVGFLTSG
jgi:pimeloyl-ACP methyl ester carboxylesterase